jgi:hypothetical protein
VNSWSAITWSGSTDFCREISVDPVQVIADQEFTYTLLIENLGPEDADRFNLWDAVPEAVEIIEFSQSPDFTTGDSIGWQITDLPAMNDLSIWYRARVNKELIDGDESVTIENLSFVTTPFDTIASNDTSRAIFVYKPTLAQTCEEIFRLDRNVYEPNRQDPLEIIVEIDSDELITIDIFDITGYRIKSLVNGTASIGINSFKWDGKTDNGQNAGSNVYIIVFRTQRSNGSLLECIQKVVLAR